MGGHGYQSEPAHDREQWGKATGSYIDAAKKKKKANFLIESSYNRPTLLSAEGCDAMH